LVVKPSRSISGGSGSTNGARDKMNVMYAHDRAELMHLAKASIDKIGSVIVQEYFRGAGVGVELLADRGEIIYAFQHKRLHELPLTGGGSCLRESVAVRPELLGHAEKLMRAVSWHGVAMVEFKLDEATGDSRLMEVNGRFWGSLPLALAAGADFPYFLLQLHTHGARPDPVADAPQIGVVSRKLADDLYWYVQVLKPDQDEPLITWPTRSSALRDALLVFSPRHRFDVQTMDDPRPGAIDVLKTGEWLMERVVSIAKHKTIERAQQRARASGEARARARKARSILFVCYGNINRSILAERHLRASIANGHAVRIASAGFHQETGRPADPAIEREAAKRGFVLGPTSSHALDRQMIDEAEVILAMEVKHLVRLYAGHPGARAKSFLLGAVTGDGPLEIVDPYGGNEAAYARCFDEITACTRAIAGTLDS
jgi:protein-tyrosine-phosphatase